MPKSVQYVICLQACCFILHGCNARPYLNVISITLTWEYSRRRRHALEKNGTKIWFWPSHRTRRSFLWTKSSRVLIEVAICIWYRYAKHRVNVIFFLTLQMQNILTWALTPDWANVIVQLFVGKRAGADYKHNWWSLSKGCIEIWKDERVSMID